VEAQSRRLLSKKNWYRVDVRKNGIILFRLKARSLGATIVRGGRPMLVLGRGKCQSVVIGDEITLTVEEICDRSDGQHILGAKVRLGFQTPRYVSIYRGELRAKRPSTVSGKVSQRLQPRTGDLVDLSDAQVRLRIQVPRKVPVRHNGTPTVGHDSEEELGGETHGPKTVHHITCHKDDRIAICNNITIAALDFHRFVFGEHSS
jgi:sRNA-binding carbon storage regulator CsrA